MGLLGTLIDIAAMIAADKAMTWFHNLQNNQNGLSPDDIVKGINILVQEATDKGEDAVSKLSQRLSNISMPFNISTAAKSFINRAKKNLETKTKDTTRKVSNVERRLNDIQSRAVNLANQSPDYRADFGTTDLYNIKKDFSDLKDQMTDIVKGVENNVKKEN